MERRIEEGGIVRDIIEPTAFGEKVDGVVGLRDNLLEGLPGDVLGGPPLGIPPLIEDLGVGERREIPGQMPENGLGLLSSLAVRMTQPETPYCSVFDCTPT
jgi:hypothetical protein